MRHFSLWILVAAVAAAAPSLGCKTKSSHGAHAAAPAPKQSSAAAAAPTAAAPTAAAHPGGIPFATHCATGVSADTCQKWKQHIHQYKLPAKNALGAPLQPSLRADNLQPRRRFSTVDFVSTETPKTLIAWYRKRMTRWKTFTVAKVLTYFAPRVDKAAAETHRMASVEVWPCQSGKRGVWACTSQVAITYATP